MEKSKAERVRYFKELMGEAFSSVQCECMVDQLDAMGFFEAPASAGHHGAYPGGLFDHSAEVTEQLLWLTRHLELKWGKLKSPYIVGMFHDLCKVNQYEQKEDGSFMYRAAAILPGHGDKSVILAQRILELTTEEILCIRWHMGAYEGKEVWNDLGAAIRECPNVLYAHTADMLATHVVGI